MIFADAKMTLSLQMKIYDYKDVLGCGYEDSDKLCLLCLIVAFVAFLPFALCFEACVHVLGAVLHCFFVSCVSCFLRELYVASKVTLRWHW